MVDNVNNTLRQLSHKKRTVNDLVSFLSNKCEDSPNYSLLIGAGCSVTSGVDSGGANDMKEKINKKILNHKEDFSKDVLISTYALLNQKNDLLRAIKQAQKSDALLKYRIKKWPVLKSFLKDEDVCNLLK